MNHRERVLMALNHETPDRCPMQISFTPEFAKRLSKEMKIQGEDSHNPHGGGNTYKLELALDEDMLLTSVGWANSYYQDGFKDGEEYVDEWGIRWKVIQYDTKYGKGRYTEVIGHPLANDDTVNAYIVPDPNRQELYRGAQKLIDNYKIDYFIVGVAVTTIFETAWALRGMEKLLMDFIINPGLAEEILNIPYQYHLTAAKKLTEMGVDMIWIGDDVGTQKAMMFSPQIWKKFIKPKMANFIFEIKKINPTLKVAYHSDGVIYPIIPDLIEIGVDVLNPVQPTAMDPYKLKKEYGDKLCFWGTLDERYTLPFGSLSEVRKEVLSRINLVGKQGGLIIGPTHNIQLDTPMNNFWVMVDTIRKTYY